MRYLLSIVSLAVAAGCASPSPLTQIGVDDACAWTYTPTSTYDLDGASIDLTQLEDEWTWHPSDAAEPDTTNAPVVTLEDLEWAAEDWSHAVVETPAGCPGPVQFTPATRNVVGAVSAGSSELGYFVVSVHDGQVDEWSFQLGFQPSPDGLDAAVDTWLDGVDPNSIRHDVTYGLEGNASSSVLSSFEYGISLDYETPDFRESRFFRGSMERALPQ